MKIKKTLLILLAILIIALVGTGGYVYVNASRIAEEIIRENFINSYNSSPETKYNIDLEEINLNILTGSVELVNISVTPKDSIVTFTRQLDEKSFENTSLVIHIGKIGLSDFDYLTAVSSRKIVIEKFEIYEPNVYIYQHLGELDPTVEKQDTIDFKDIFLTHYDTFLVKEVVISNALSTYYQVNDKADTLEVFSINHISYMIKDVQANKETLNKAPFVSYDEFILESKNIGVHIKDKATLKIKNVTFTSKDHQIEVKGIELVPLLTPQKFFKQLKYRKAWIKLKAKKIAINIDFEKWLEIQHVLINDLTLTNPELEVHTNSNFPFAPKTIKPMLGTMLTSLPLEYQVKNITINNALISLFIIGKNTPNPGKLTFDKMNITAHNLTNIPNLISDNQFFEIDANTKINKTGQVNTKLKIDLADSKSMTQFIVEGKNLDLKRFNSVLEPIILVGVKAGEMKSLKIFSYLNSEVAYGTMDTHYENLRLNLKKKDLNKNSGFFLKLASDVANGVVKNDNIPDSPNYHTGKFKFDKHPTDAFFKMLWLITMHGLEDSILGSDKRDTRQAKKVEKANKPKKKLIKRGKKSKK